MIPILFEYNATSFTTHGIGDLIDCTDCVVQLTADGEYELSFNYPITGELIHELTIGRLVYVKANPWQNNQIFRIYGYEKGIGGIITVNCQHISYDLANIPVKNFKSAASATANTVMANMKTNSISITGLSVNSFTFTSNVSGTAHTVDGYFELSSPSTVRSVLLDGESSIQGCFGGDYVFDNYTVSLLSTGGSDRGVVVEYGVDLMDLRQEENISETVTGILPYYTYTDTQDVSQTTYGSVQYATGTFRSHKVAPMSMNEYFPDQAEHTSPTAAQLNTKAQQWIASEADFGKPEINLTLSYAQLGQDVRLHDAVTVRFVKMGIDVKSKVVSVKYDVLKERILEVQVGKTKQSIVFSLEDASRLRRGLLPPARIKDKSLTSSKYADNSVITSALDDAAVTASKLKDSAVTESKINDAAVTESKINDAAVTHGKLGGGSVGANNMQDASVPTRSLQDYAVTEGKINGGAVTEAKIGGGAVSTSKLADGAATESKIANEAVSEVKVKPLAITVSRIANGAVQTTKIQDGAVITDKILNKAVTYAKSAYQGTLDQVDINAADIAAINLLFVGGATATSIITQALTCTGGSQLQGGISTSTINSGDIYCGSVNASGVYVNGNRVALASEIPSLSGYATEQYARNYADSAVTYHQWRCANYSPSY